ncbi:MAG: VWA domain-containing protein [Candidatus Omnitrophica bacterium]|nr:VWA domain-containing protein [Candidatus Omnitrophota bacterium]
MIKFANPYFFIVLACYAAIIFFLLWSARIRKRRLKAFADKNLLDRLLSELDGKKRRLKMSLLAAGVFLCLFSFLRPQWGFYWKTVEKEGLDILVAIDTSKSMLAEDIKPNRLERTKLAVRDLLKYFDQDRIGLIAFSGSAFTICPLTLDYYGFVLSLNEIDTSIIPLGGTSLSGAIEEALRGMQYSQGPHKTLMLITDGEDNTGGALEAAEKAKDAGLKVFCIGIGTPEGEIIPVTDEQGRKTFLRNKEGNVVKTRLDEEALKRIALITEGAYIRATPTDFGLEGIYKQQISKTGERKLSSYKKKEFIERFQFLLGIAVLFLALEPLISEKKKTL